MAVQARVIFTRFGGVDDLELRPWLSHINRVLRKQAPTIAPMVDPTVWQLMSANNRELARSAGVFPGFRAAADAASNSVGELRGAVVRPVVDEGRGLLGWYLVIEDRPVVVCSRWYFAERERSQAVNLALASLAAATLAQSARVAIERSPKEQDSRVR